MKPEIKSLFSAFFLLMASAAWGDGREGGGGHAVRVQTTEGEKTYLFDFFEGGIESNILIESECNLDSNLLSRIQNTLDLSVMVSRKIGCKIQQVRAVSKSAAEKLTDTLLSYQWQRILPEIFRRYDIGRTPIQNESGNPLPLIQAAIRFDDTKVVYIDRGVWNLLPEEHQIGLIFHEILFAIYTQQYTGKYIARMHPAYNFDHNFYWCYTPAVLVRKRAIPDSSTSRALNVFLFSSALQASTKQTFKERWDNFLRDAGTRYTITEEQCPR
jgi:hypothetical protein